MTKPFTTDMFIDRSRAKHGDLYDYSRVSYTNTTTKVTIGCPEHGWFEQVPMAHFKHGCNACGGTARKPLDQRIAKAREVHGDRYSYKLLTDAWVPMKAKVPIICRQHGVFHQSMEKHGMGRGCPTCAQIVRERKLIAVGRANALDRMIAAHGDRYDYSRVVYRHSDTPVEIVCRDHGPFLQTVGNHAAGKGCSVCGRVNIAFRGNSPYTLYYVALFKDGFPPLWKIGITKHANTQIRFANEGVRIETLWSRRFEHGYDAALAEANLQHSFKDFVYDGPQILAHTGNTEIFTKNVLAAV